MTSDEDIRLERLLHTMAKYLDQLNDHLAQIAGELHYLNENAPVTEFRRDHGRDRP